MIGYKREQSVYRRLEQRNIFSVRNFTIPRVSNFDDDLLIIEMSIVHTPCVLDFGGAYVDEYPEYAERDEDWMNEKKNLFGDNWDEAMSIIRELEFKASICLGDIHTGNIKFE